VLFASKFSDIKIIKKTHPPKRHRTVAHAIRQLEPITAGQASPKDPIHRASALSALNLRRIKSMPPGGRWKEWSADLVLACHKKDSGKTYRDIYGRMSWDKPAPTMTTQCNGLGNGRFGHPEQHRAISLREAALLQTFPIGYCFVEPEADFSIKALARHIGNAVPVRLGRIIARTIKRHLHEQDA
jgi:DNA (cytosine-5)-methyltransferase 1